MYVAYALILLPLTQGSGTLCEALLMVEAYRGNIVCPNKHVRYATIHAYSTYHVPGT